MFQAYSRVRGYQPAIWAAVTEERVLALFLPVRIRTMDGIMGKWMARDVSFGSVLWEPSAEGISGLEILMGEYRDESRKKTCSRS